MLPPLELPLELLLPPLLVQQIVHQRCLELLLVNLAVQVLHKTTSIVSSLTLSLLWMMSSNCALVNLSGCFTSMTMAG